ACAEGEDQYLSQRSDPGRSDAMAAVFDAALDIAGATGDDMDMLDIYSCFPCAVQAACEALQVAASPTRPLTVTGGLPYFGGPGNNYVMHVIAEMTARLRGGRARGLITANGGILSKHAAAVLCGAEAACEPPDWGEFQPPVLPPESFDAVPFSEDPTAGSVITYTVIAGRKTQDIGIVLGEDDNGARFLASSTDAATTQAMLGASPVGRRVVVSNEQERNVFSFA
ncbi:MAG: acetyl-CoA acetyltransferase, partial [Halioglobus sp.]|nr:acetyl-CoA acetyltransferase [Halioglobus sp.]